MDDSRAIQGVEPARCEAAADDDQLGRIVRQCAADGQCIADYGTAHQGLGHPPPDAHVQVDLPSGIIEHYVGDMTVRVHAGTPLGHVQETLRPTNQFLPIDAADSMTVGEIIAHNVYGPLRLGYGAMRDLLLGLHYVDADGQSIHVGGRTVKNVAGYDVTKLMVGGLNTLGLITEATLRTYAIPQQVTQVTVTPFCPTTLDAQATSLLTGDAAPLYLDFQFPASGAAARPTLHLAYAGAPTGCEAQCEALGRWLASVELPPDAAQRSDGTLDDDLSARQARRQWRDQASALVNLIVPSTHTGQTIHNLRHGRLPMHTAESLPAHGVIWLGGQWTIDEARAADEVINQIINAAGGMRLWLKRPDDSPAIAPFAPPQPDWTMQMKIKETMDAKAVFNKGRFL